MTSFKHYLDQYNMNGCKNAGFKVEKFEKRLEVPEVVKCDTEATDFFAGKNVWMEEISTTCGFFQYKATVHAKDTLSCALEEFKQIVCRGLEELKIAYNSCDFQKVPKKELVYEVTITV